jgi:hypothetical protein
VAAFPEGQQFIYLVCFPEKSMKFIGLDDRESRHDQVENGSLFVTKEASIGGR